MKNKKNEAAAPATGNKKYSRRPRFLTVVMLIVLAVCLILDSACAYDLFGRTPVPVSDPAGKVSEEDKALIEENQSLIDEQRSEEEAAAEDHSIGYVPSPVITPKDEQIIVMDERSAMEALVSMQEELGIGDVEREYRCSNEAHYDFGDSYTMQQYYDGIPVFGSTLRMSVDPAGNITNVSGMYIPIRNLGTQTQISESSARDRLRGYLKNQYLLNDPDIDSEGKIIYMDQGAPLVCYLFYANNAVIIVDANSGAVVLDASLDVELEVQKTIGGERASAEAWHADGNRTVEVVQESEGEYLLGSESRNIYAYDAHADNYDTRGADNSYTDIYRFTDADTSSLNAFTNDAFANVEIVYDVYKQKFKRAGLRNDENAELRLISYFSNYDNACCSGDSVIRIGDHTPSPNYAFYLDVLAHEFTHGIVFNSCTLSLGCTYNTNAQPLAINEGLADIFGEVIEYYHTGSCNWVTGPLSNRNATSPNGAAATLNEFVSNNMEEHAGAYLVSHPFYLMTLGVDKPGNKLSIETAATLYYRMITNKLTMGANYRTLRQEIEAQALEMNRKKELSDQQIECVLDALDKVEIPNSYDYSVTPDATIRFVDNKGNPFPQGEITIYRYGTNEVVLNSEKADAKGELKLNNRVIPGIYDGIISVPNGATERFTFVINDKANNNDPYKNKVVVTLDSTYISIVLDVSGSMDGEPIRAAKEAAVSLVSTVFRNAPWARISLITYSDSVSTLVTTSNNLTELTNAINGISSGGGTNMYEGVSTGRSYLTQGLHKLVFIMGDGMPNNGENYNGDYNSPLVSLSNDLKDEGVTVFSFGFFHSLSGSTLSEAQDLMRRIASANYYYNVSSASDLNGAFTFIAGELADIGRTIHIRVECPVDVTVTYNGQTLSSAENGRNVSTDFGLITFEGENNDIKVLNLRAGPDYEICLNGTDTGTMNYTISYSDENGEYVDTRTFENVPLTKKTLITTSTGQEKDTRMEVDKDGDGKTDLIYTAGSNKTAKRKNAANVTLYILIGASAIAVLILALLILRMVRRSKKNKVCANCGAPRQKSEKFCKKCGHPAENLPLLLPKKVERRQQTKGRVIAKLVVIAAALGLTAGVIALYLSPATSVYKKLQEGKYTSANVTYRKSVKNEDLKKGYLNLITGAYLNRVDDLFINGKVSETDAIPVWTAVAGMKLGKASEKAEENLKEQGVELSPQKEAPEEETTEPIEEDFDW